MTQALLNYFHIILSLFRFANCIFNKQLIQDILRLMQRILSVKQAFSGSSKAYDLFGHVEMAPQDPIIGTKIAYNKDQTEQKVNLGQGVYKDNQGNGFVFQVVRKIEENIIKTNINHEYLDMEGLPQFVTGARNLLFGQNSQAVKNQRIASVQSISGTGALGVGFDFLAKYLPRIVYISNPTWAIHRSIIEKHHLKCLQYPYYNPALKGLDFQAMTDFLGNAIPGSYVVLHPCAHNPTGFDMNQQQWMKLAQVMKRNNLIPFFDCAYQGFATGDLQKDVWPVRYFVQSGFQLFAAQSFAKNMGLYGERVGALHAVLNTKETAEKAASQIKIIIRTIYSSPSRYGATIAATILNNPQYFQQWQKQLDTVSYRIKQVRGLLRNELERIKTPGTWSHITEQIGMFSYTGLSEKVCSILTNKYHVYLLKTGRISMSGVNRQNVKYLAQSIKSAIIEAGQS